MRTILLVVKNRSSNKFFKMIMIIKVMNINFKFNAQFYKYIIWSKIFPNLGIFKSTLFYKTSVL